MTLEDLLLSTYEITKILLDFRGRFNSLRRNFDHVINGYLPTIRNRTSLTIANIIGDLVFGTEETLAQFIAIQGVPNMFIDMYLDHSFYLIIEYISNRSIGKSTNRIENELEEIVGTNPRQFLNGLWNHYMSIIKKMSTHRI